MAPCACRWCWLESGRVGSGKAVADRVQRRRDLAVVERFAQVNFDAAADGVERQVVGVESERLLDLVAERVEPEEGVGDDADHEGGHEADRVDQAERQQEAVHVGGAVQQQRVGERDRGAFDPFAGGRRRRHGRQGGVDRAAQAVFDLAFAQAGAQVLAHLLHQEVGQVRVFAGQPPFLLLQQAFEFLGPADVAQVLAQRVGVGDGAVDHAHPHVAQAEAGGGRPRAFYQAQALAREAAALVHQFAPQLAPLPIAVVGGVVAKAEEDRERQAHQGERDGGQRDLQLEQVAVRPGHQGRDQQVDQQGEADARQDRAAQHQEQAQSGRAVAQDHAARPARRARARRRQEPMFMEANGNNTPAV
jgi:hypothetical protein